MNFLKEIRSISKNITIGLIMLNGFLWEDKSFGFIYNACYLFSFKIYCTNLKTDIAAIVLVALLIIGIVLKTNFE